MKPGDDGHVQARESKRSSADLICRNCSDLICFCTRAFSRGACLRMDERLLFRIVAGEFRL